MRDVERQRAGEIRRGRQRQERHGRDGKRDTNTDRDGVEREDRGGQTGEEGPGGRCSRPGSQAPRGRLSLRVVSCESVLDPMILRGPADSENKEDPRLLVCAPTRWAPVLGWEVLCSAHTVFLKIRPAFKSLETLLTTQIFGFSFTVRRCGLTAGAEVRLPRGGGRAGRSHPASPEAATLSVLPAGSCQHQGF